MFPLLWQIRGLKAGQEKNEIAPPDIMSGRFSLSLEIFVGQFSPSPSRMYPSRTNLDNIVLTWSAELLDLEMQNMEYKEASKPV